MSAEKPGVAAVLLAGGASRRMGRPKPFLRVGGRELAARLLDRAAAVTPELLLSVAHADPFREALPTWGWTPVDGAGPEGDVFRKNEARLRVVPDRRPGLGPLAGVESCCGATRAGRCLLLAADLPFATAAFFRTLLAEFDRLPAAGLGDRESSPPAIVVPVVAGRRQPLCSVFDRGAGEIATDCLDRGRRSVAAWVDRLAVHEIRAAQRELFDLDTPEDLRRARSWRGKGRPPGTEAPPSVETERTTRGPRG